MKKINIKEDLLGMDEKKC